MDLLPNTDYSGPLVLVAYYNSFNIISVAILDDEGNILNLITQAVMPAVAQSYLTIIPYDSNSFVVAWQDQSPCCGYSLYIVLIRLDGK